MSEEQEQENGWDDQPEQVEQSIEEPVVQDYQCITMQEAQHKLEALLAKVNEQWGIGNEYAFIILLHFKFDANKVNEKMCEGQEDCVSKIGTLLKYSLTNTEVKCVFCDFQASQSTIKLNCGHYAHPLCIVREFENCYPVEIKEPKEESKEPQCKQCK